MNLISCNDCGTVFDKDKLKFSEDIYMDSGAVDITKGGWNGDNYAPFVTCPVCDCTIFGELR